MGNHVSLPTNKSLRRRRYYVYERPTHYASTHSIANPPSIESQYQSQIFDLSEQNILPIQSQKETCIICHERIINTKFNCNHCCVCYQCAYDWIKYKEEPTCPLCREPITKVILNYKLEFPVFDSRSLQ